MMIRTATIRILMPLIVVFGLTACETLGLGSDRKDEKADLACPPVEAPASVSNLTQNGVSANLRVTGSKCKVADDGVTMQVFVDLAATRGSSAKGGDVSLPFFAAVVDKSGTLLNKKMYETTFTFSGDDTTSREELTISFGLTRDQATTTTILMGYQLSRKAWQTLNP